MAWDTGYLSAEQAAQERAAAEASMRLKMSPYEQQMLRAIVRLADAVDAIGATIAEIHRLECEASGPSDGDIEERAAAMYYGMHGDDAPGWENLPFIPDGVRAMFTRLARVSYGLAAEEGPGRGAPGPADPMHRASAEGLDPGPSPAASGSRGPGGVAGTASAEPVDPSPPTADPGSARPDLPGPGAVYDMGARMSAAAEMFPQHSKPST